MIDTQKRYGNTGKKMVSLTHTGREQIQTYADAHGLSFSAAIETLALIGMEADLTALLVPVLRETVDKALQRNFNRLAKLTLLAAAEGAMAHDIATMILLQMVRQAATDDPAGFEEAMLVSYDPADALDARIRAVYDDMRAGASERQQRLLRASLDEIVARLNDADGRTEADGEKEGEDG